LFACSWRCRGVVCGCRHPIGVSVKRCAARGRPTHNNRRTLFVPVTRTDRTLQYINLVGYYRAPRTHPFRRAAVLSTYAERSISSRAATVPVRVAVDKGDVHFVTSPRVPLSVPSHPSFWRSLACCLALSRSSLLHYHVYRRIAITVVQCEGFCVPVRHRNRVSSPDTSVTGQHLHNMNALRLFRAEIISLGTVNRWKYYTLYYDTFCRTSSLVYPPVCR
jgi:hypothetical protein